MRKDERRCYLELSQLTRQVVVGFADVCENVGVFQHHPGLERSGVSVVVQNCVKGHLCFHW